MRCTCSIAFGLPFMSDFASFFSLNGTLFWRNVSRYCWPSALRCASGVFLISAMRASVCAFCSSIVCCGCVMRTPSPCCSLGRGSGVTSAFGATAALGAACVSCGTGVTISLRRSSCGATMLSGAVSSFTCVGTLMRPASVP